MFLHAYSFRIHRGCDSVYAGHSYNLFNTPERACYVPFKALLGYIGRATFEGIK